MYTKLEQGIAVARGVFVRLSTRHCPIPEGLGDGYVKVAVEKEGRTHLVKIRFSFRMSFSTGGGLRALLKQRSEPAFATSVSAVVSQELSATLATEVKVVEVRFFHPMLTDKPHDTANTRIVYRNVG